MTFSDLSLILAGRRAHSQFFTNFLTLTNYLNVCISKFDNFCADDNDKHEPSNLLTVGCL